jgi:hypothetical protein
MAVDCWAKTGIATSSHARQQAVASENSDIRARVIRGLGTCRRSTAGGRRGNGLWACRRVFRRGLRAQTCVGRCRRLRAGRIGCSGCRRRDAGQGRWRRLRPAGGRGDSGGGRRRRRGCGAIGSGGVGGGNAAFGGTRRKQDHRDENDGVSTHLDAPANTNEAFQHPPNGEAISTIRRGIHSGNIRWCARFLVRRFRHSTAAENPIAK